jgi:double-GTPase-like protein
VTTLSLLPRFRLACPYCYQIFPEWQIEFRCSGRAGEGGKRCEPTPDLQQENFFGASGDQLHTFRDVRHRYRSICSVSGAPTTTRVCPKCHSTLPVHFGRIRGQLVALVGARDSGKTVFMTVLMHEFGYRLGDRLGASIPGADDETRKSFRRDYEQRLYEGHSLPDPTFTVAAERQGYRPPMVFRFKRQARSRLPGGTRQTLLSFFDTAGEDLTTKASTELNGRYLEAANAIILILDPLQMAGGRRLATSEALQQEARPEDDPYSVLQRITEMLQAGHRDRRVRKPLAVVFTKLDALWHEFADGSALKRPESRCAGCDELDSLDVHHHVQALLHDWDGRQIDQYLQHNYRCFQYFGVSALGAIPTPDRRVSEVIQPYRVGDPILWLLSRAHIVPIIRRG